jgi:NAD(P)-dependent dehydrogenase (short-subunit alcohol dehydrogenase family)
MSAMGDRWSVADIPGLGGVGAVVTGANSGLGLHTAIGLARAGAQVVMGCRDAARGDAALAQVRAAVPDARAVVLPLDLADLASVREFAAAAPDAVDSTESGLGLLVNNAGVMAIPRRETADGFEMQLGTNHLGHFALTGLLLGTLLKGSLAGGAVPASAPPTPTSRVVTVSSGVHRAGSLHRDDLMLTRGYGAWTAYNQSKLANLLFAYELQRKVDAAGLWGSAGGKPALSLLSVAAHPGYAATNLQGVGPAMTGSRFGSVVMRIGNTLLAQSAEHGAWPSLRAATDPGVRGGEYYGPGGLGEQRGRPKRVGSSAASRDEADAAWLWDRSVELTGVAYEELKPRHGE